MLHRQMISLTAEKNRGSHTRDPLQYIHNMQSILNACHVESDNNVTSCKSHHSLENLKSFELCSSVNLS